MLRNRGRTNRRTLGTTFIYIKWCALHIKQERKIIGHEHSRSAVIAALNKSLYEFDLKQEEQEKLFHQEHSAFVVSRDPEKPFYLLKSSTYMHLKHPDWDIALVFFTRSLYDSFIAQVDKWLRHFSNGETCYDEIVKRKIKVLHAWGAKDREGFIVFYVDVME